MIFGKEFDLSLWYMLNTKNKYRKKIIELLNELPEEAFEKIENLYSEIIYNRQILEKHRINEIIQTSTYIISNNLNPDTSYKIYSNAGNLIIDKRKKINGNIKDVLSLELSRLDFDSFKYYKNGDIKNISIGSIGIGQFPTINFKEVDYDLRKTPFGNMVMCTHIFLINYVNIKSFQLPIIKELPEEVEIYRKNVKVKKLITKTNITTR